MGRVLSELVKKGLQAGATSYISDGHDNLPVFRVREGSPPITLSDVRRAEDEA